MGAPSSSLPSPPSLQILDVMDQRVTIQSMSARCSLRRAMVTVLVAGWVCCSMRPVDSGSSGSGVASTWRGGPSCPRGSLAGNGDWTPFGQVRGMAGHMSHGQLSLRGGLRGGDGEEEAPAAASAAGDGVDVGELPPLHGDLPPLNGELPLEDFVWSEEFGKTFDPLFMTGMTPEQARVLKPKP